MRVKKHGQIVRFLKSDHGVTHGFANLIAAKTRIDLGLALKGEAISTRLESYNAMCSHRVRLESQDDIDNQLKDWIKLAYNRAG